MAQRVFLLLSIFIMFVMAGCEYSQEGKSRVITDSHLIIQALENSHEAVSTPIGDKFYVNGDPVIVVHNEDQLKMMINYNKALWAESYPSGKVKKLQCEGSGDRCTVVSIDGEPTILVRP